MVKQVTSKLGFDWTKVFPGPVTWTYKEYFDVTTNEINKCLTIAFGPVLEWLEKRRIKK